MNILRSAIALAFLYPATAYAAALDCTVNQKSNEGWVPPRILLQLDQRVNSAFVFDGYVKEVYGEPIPAELTKRSDHSYKFRWTLVGIKSSNDGSTSVSYRVTLNTAKQTFTMSGILHGGDNSIFGRGTCKKIN